ncbi:unnamed protein product [Rotaria sordida]|uniref:Uncharacterized protein n=1 Tax=Rotaria sordida TaxID=392033 RepID=A0A814U6C0_9BILA|nr:unnamed protein product [Rotaria sordida]CAF1167810.1 unnamed protein product [Rotaria sordida]CAF1287305.1 unnamed protein product [Rotaria sordida]CAF4041246.1 unnamed protein product [Rotaria sordida]
MSSMDKGVYRLVPYRFFINESHLNVCKLEKLTNLFPEMKLIIELELFKINNLSRMVERLSLIYKVSPVVDNRDDTLHLFLGPYHLTLGPAIFGALHFKNISTALLASSHSKSKTDNTNQSHKRRREAVLRRFRRTVRKLIFIKSIIDQVHLASVLTPYNQYALYKQGIYDLALAGHIHGTNSVFYDENFIEQMNNTRLMSASENENPLLASKFIKINSILQLLSPPTAQQQPDNNSTIGNITEPKSDSSISYTTDENSSKSFINSTNLCCPQHINTQDGPMFPVSRSTNYQSNSFLSQESPSGVQSRRNSRRRSVALLKPSTTISLPDLTFEPTLSPNPTVLKLNKSKDSPSSQEITTNQEDILVDNISSILINYLVSQQSMPSNTNDNHKEFDDNKVSLTSTTIKATSNDSDTSNQLLSIVKTNEFDNLLQRIKTIVDNSLSVKIQNNDQVSQATDNHQNLPYNSTKTTIKQKRRQQLFTLRTVSWQETSTNEFNTEHVESSNNK